VRIGNAFINRFETILKMGRMIWQGRVQDVANENSSIRAEAQGLDEFVRKNAVTKDEIVKVHIRTNLHLMQWHCMNASESSLFFRSTTFTLTRHQPNMYLDDQIEDTLESIRTEASGSIAKISNRLMEIEEHARPSDTVGYV
jgi:hypothetical protein